MTPRTDRAKSLSRRDASDYEQGLWGALKALELWALCEDGPEPLGDWLEAGEQS